MKMQISGFKVPAALICIYSSSARWTAGQRCRSVVYTGAAHTHRHTQTHTEVGQVGEEAVQGDIPEELRVEKVVFCLSACVRLCFCLQKADIGV